MSEVGEIYKELREQSAIKRENNRDQSVKLLEDNGIPFEVKNYGVHIVVDHTIDFWPGTGLWIVRETKMRKRGVLRLIKWVKYGRS